MPFTVLRVHAKMWRAIFLLGFTVAFGSARQLKLVSEWKSIDFNFPSDQVMRDVLVRKDFIPGMAVPIDVDVYYKGFYLLTAR
jgi:hypothetical protein